MITASDETFSILNSASFTFAVRVESWLDGSLLVSDIPFSAGEESVDRSLSVPERVTLTVPRYDHRTDTTWAPDSDDHPLAANGQRLRVLFGVAADGKRFEWLQRGWFVIAESALDGDSVSVTALGLLSLIQEARLVSPYQPSGTIGSSVRGLIEPALTVDLTAAPSDRSVPSDMNIDEDRLAGVLSLLDAWGAEGYVTAEGIYRVVESDTVGDLPVSLGENGTIIRIAGASTRENAYNCVVARGTASDGGIVQGVAYETAGPKAFDGPFNPLAVPYFYASPLLTTVAQCNTAAATVLDRLRRTNAQRWKLTIVPNPLLQAGDGLILADEPGAPTCTLEAFRLPYVPDGGAMELQVRGLD